MRSGLRRLYGGYSRLGVGLGTGMPARPGRIRGGYGFRLVIDLNVAIFHEASAAKADSSAPAATAPSGWHDCEVGKKLLRCNRVEPVVAIGASDAHL